MDKLHFDRTDYSVVVKNRAPPPSSWKWEIYRAGRSSPVKQSSVYFHTVVTASRAGKRSSSYWISSLQAKQHGAFRHSICSQDGTDQARKFDSFHLQYERSSINR